MQLNFGLKLRKNEHNSFKKGGGPREEKSGEKKKEFYAYCGQSLSRTDKLDKLLYVGC